MDNGQQQLNWLTNCTYHDHAYGAFYGDDGDGARNWIKGNNQQIVV